MVNSHSGPSEHAKKKSRTEDDMLCVRVWEIPSQYSLNTRVSQHRYYYINYYGATFLSGVRVQVGPPRVTLGVIKV